MASEALLHQIGLNVDALISCDLLSYGVIGPLFERTRERQGGGPLSLQGARLLAERLNDGGSALIATGLILPGHHPYGETDGPLGAAVLARALAFGLERPVAVACEAELAGLLAALLRRAGLQVVAPEALAAGAGHRPAAAVLAIPTGEAEAAAWAEHTLEGLDVRAVVSIERNGANAEGRYCMVNGTDLSDGIGKAVPLMTACRRRGIASIGIGDRGNELGFGPVTDIVAAILPRGALAADTTPSSLVLPATVSNWGAYGLVACLAALLEQPELLHSAELELALAETAVAAGGVDGMSGRAEPGADGIGAAVHAALATLLQEAYRARSARNPSPFSTPLIEGREGAATGTT
ncbi:MAG: glutamate cyclase domain-containing protein [Tistlia sp.]|uniref:glutamate cyclase domain-containing protein n=1 Tax=Tistlia sp. TaxID=3057121 RepID=UPI0034A46193